MSFISQTSLPTDDRVLISNAPCLNTVQIGTWVRLNESNLFVPAQADLFENSDVVGLVEEKPSLDTANILVMGISKPIFNSLDTTKNYFLSVSNLGNMYVPPVNTQGQSVVLCLGRPITEDKFLVRIHQRLVRS